MKKPENGQRWVPHAETLPEALGGLERRILAYGSDLMCVENCFDEGGEGKLHQHPHTQLTYICSGAFAFTIDGETRTMEAGDTAFIPGGVEHGCVCLKAGTLLDIFTPMREDFV